MRAIKSQLSAEALAMWALVSNTSYRIKGRAITLRDATVMEYFAMRELWMFGAVERPIYRPLENTITVWVVSRMGLGNVWLQTTCGGDR